MILKTSLIFLLSFGISFILWLQVKDSYGYMITLVVSKLVAGVKNAKLDMITPGKDSIHIMFSSLKANLFVNMSVKISTYTFNVPLTLAIMASLHPYILRRKRAYAEAGLILLLVHILYVFFREARPLTEIFMSKGVEVFSATKLYVYNFFYEFTGSMVIRFEPFLIGFYLFIRFRR